MEDPRDLRPSDVSAWLLCPKRVELKHTQQQYPSFAMTRGSLLHARIEHLLNGGRSFAWEDEYDQIVQRDTNDDVTVDDLPSAAVASLVNDAQQAYLAWTKDVYPLIIEYGDDITVEHRLELVLPVELLVLAKQEYVITDYLIAGTPDLVIPEEKWIIDWKTANAPWKDDKKQGELQPAAYTALNGWTESKFSFFVFDFKNMEWNQHTVYVTKEQVNAWLDLAADVAASMSAGIYPAKPQGQGWKARGWHCSPKYCSAWNICDAKHLIADGQAIEVRDPKEEWI